MNSKYYYYLPLFFTGRRVCVLCLTVCKLVTLLLLSHNDDDEADEGDVDDRFTLEVEVGGVVENAAEIDGNTVLLVVAVVVVVLERL